MTDLNWIPVQESTQLSSREAMLLQEQMAVLMDALDVAESNGELAREELDAVVGRMTDVIESGWVEMTAGASNSGLSLATLKRISERLRDMVDTNPLMHRGHQLRRDYVYARGVEFDIQPPTAVEKVTRKIEDPYNWELFFSEEGHDTLMRARHTDGNRFTLVNKSTKQTIHVPLSQIAQSITDENDSSRVMYLQRTVGTKSTWYATDLNPNPAEQVTAGGQTHTIDSDWVLIHKAYNRPIGATWGLPDMMAAYLWVIAYSNYLKDNAALVKALSRIAIKISAPTAAGAKNASQKFSAADKGPAGRTAVTGSDVRIDAMGNTGSGVNFNNGRPLAAMVATSLGVSIVALLSDPGTGGSYGVAETLDPPTTLLAMTLQSSEADYYKRLLAQYGANAKTTVKFPTIDKDPAYRVLQSIYQGVGQGILSREEARPVISLLLDMSNLDADKLPEPDGFNMWRDPDPTAPSPAAGDGKVGSDPTPRQGNSGVAGSVDQGTNNDARDNGEKV